MGAYYAYFFLYVLLHILTTYSYCIPCCLGVINMFITSVYRMRNLHKFLSACQPSTTQYIIFNMPGRSMSDISNNAGLSTRTTKNLHVAIISLCLILTVHTPNCLILDSLYVFNTNRLFFVAHNSSLLDFGNNTLKILNGIRSLLAPELIVYVLCTLLWLVLDKASVLFCYLGLLSCLIS